MKQHIFLALMVFSVVNMCGMQQPGTNSSNTHLQQLLTSLRTQKALLNNCMFEIQTTNNALQSGPPSVSLADKLTVKQAERDEINNRIQELYQSARSTGVYDDVTEQLDMSNTARILSESARGRAISSRQAPKKKGSCLGCCVQE